MGRSKPENHMTFSDYRSALEATKVAVYKYNNKRPHRSVDFMLPVDAHKESGPLKKHWKKQEFDTTEKSASENKTGNENQRASKHRYLLRRVAL